MFTDISRKSVHGSSKVHHAKEKLLLVCFIFILTFVTIFGKGQRFSTPTHCTKIVVKAFDNVHSFPNGSSGKIEFLECFLSWFVLSISSVLLISFAPKSHRKLGTVAFISPFLHTGLFGCFHSLGKVGRRRTLPHMPSQERRWQFVTMWRLQQSFSSVLFTTSSATCTCRRLVLSIMSAGFKGCGAPSSRGTISPIRTPQAT